MATATSPGRRQQEAGARLELGGAEGRGWPKGLEPGRIPLDKGGGDQLCSPHHGKAERGILP